jgi:hypothetical protein
VRSYSQKIYVLPSRKNRSSNLTNILSDSVVIDNMSKQIAVVVFL